MSTVTTHAQETIHSKVYNCQLREKRGKRGRARRKDEEKMKKRNGWMIGRSEDRREDRGEDRQGEWKRWRAGWEGEMDRNVESRKELLMNT